MVDKWPPFPYVCKKAGKVRWVHRYFIDGNAK
jgi:hypothetical protein